MEHAEKENAAQKLLRGHGKPEESVEGNEEGKSQIEIIGDPLPASSPDYNSLMAELSLRLERRDLHNCPC
ncbi:hypothetical protein LDENG_00179150 [Lucifuga dentata]|nr:hypothetical protein LDENG_00179150 [Lucifuga dentata]